MNDKNPPTARAGIRASMGVEHAASTAGDTKGAEPRASSTSPTGESANATSASMLNPEASSESVDRWTMTRPDQIFGLEDDPNWPDAGGTDDERKAFLREALGAYRAMLVGMRMRKRIELDNGFAGALNPEGMRKVALDDLTMIRLGIAKANVLLAELGDEQPSVEP